MPPPRFTPLLYDFRIGCILKKNNYFVTKENTMNYTERVVINPAIMLGKPVIKGTRITVELILRKLSEGMNVEQLLASYQHLHKKDVYAALT
jgi:uncharacterized protein (DUF433 family)